MKIMESYQIPRGNVSPYIFKLPCIDEVNKLHEGCVYVGRGICAFETDWLCKDADDRWHVLTNEEYQQEIKEL